MPIFLVDFHTRNSILSYLLHVTYISRFETSEGPLQLIYLSHYSRYIARLNKFMNNYYYNFPTKFEVKSKDPSIVVLKGSTTTDPALNKYKYLHKIYEYYINFILKRFGDEFDNKMEFGFG